MTNKIKLSIKSSKKEHQQRQQFDTDRRDKASNILSPDQIQGKAWRTVKVLETTLGLRKGEKPRKITRQDLLAFNRNIQTLQGKVEKGLTANEIIRMSTDADKERSKKEITMAVPVRMKGGNVQFITNAGPDSKQHRHHVQVILASYDTGLAEGTPLQAAKELARGNLKFDCSCEHHTFVFRYITTLMGANAGRAETGFPKIRNPQLEGIACKHVLRVMTELNTSIFIWKCIAAMVEADRKQNADKTRSKLQKTVAMTQKEASELATKQHRNPRVIKAMAELLQSVPPHKKQTLASKAKGLSGLVIAYKNAGIDLAQLKKMDENGILMLPEGITRQQLFAEFGT